MTTRVIGRPNPEKSHYCDLPDEYGPDREPTGTLIECDGCGRRYISTPAREVTRGMQQVGNHWKEVHRSWLEKRRWNRLQAERTARALLPARTNPELPCEINMKKGWSCLRGYHSDGPCALVEDGVPVGVGNQPVLSVGDIAMSKSILVEIDRNARAYGWEVGNGHPLARKIVETSPDNPFTDKNWQSKISQDGPGEDFDD